MSTSIVHGLVDPKIRGQPVTTKCRMGAPPRTRASTTRTGPGLGRAPSRALLSPLVEVQTDTYPTRFEREPG